MSVVVGIGVPTPLVPWTVDGLGPRSVSSCGPSKRIVAGTNKTVKRVVCGELRMFYVVLSTMFFGRQRETFHVGPGFDLVEV